MLLQRILTAVPLAIAAVWFILSQSGDALFYVLLVVIAIAAWEWAQLSGIKPVPVRIAYAAALTLLVYLSGMLLTSNDPVLFKVLLGLVFAWWLYIIYRLSTGGPSAVSEQFSFAKAITGFVVLLVPVLSIVYIHQLPQGAYWLLYSIIIVWIADSGAYFSGKKFGKNKLLPLISPGKTMEGLYGAIIATTIYTFMAALFFKLDIIQTVILLIIGFFATLISVAGDLYISLLKRERGVKDSGSILPGHGGVLDRVDSILSSAPFFALFLDLMVINVQ
ncbi:MAG: phosphatidate cytidylyltransferase [Gammaproteobacteria bacterium]|nr:phosphatidate cytidylyltransferase [Gammaproteobacteria bacterium]